MSDLTFLTAFNNSILDNVVGSCPIQLLQYDAATLHLSTKDISSHSFLKNQKRLYRELKPQRRQINHQHAILTESRAVLAYTISSTPTQQSVTNGSLEPSTIFQLQQEPLSSHRKLSAVHVTSYDLVSSYTEASPYKYALIFSRKIHRKKRSGSNRNSVVRMSKLHKDYHSLSPSSSSRSSTISQSDETSSINSSSSGNQHGTRQPTSGTNGYSFVHKKRHSQVNFSKSDSEKHKKYSNRSSVHSSQTLESSSSSTSPSTPTLDTVISSLPHRIPWLNYSPQRVETVVILFNQKRKRKVWKQCLRDVMGIRVLNLNKAIYKTSTEPLELDMQSQNNTPVAPPLEVTQDSKYLKSSHNQYYDNSNSHRPIIKAASDDDEEEITYFNNQHPYYPQQLRHHNRQHNSQQQQALENNSVLGEPIQFINPKSSTGDKKKSSSHHHHEKNRHHNNNHHHHHNSNNNHQQKQDLESSLREKQTLAHDSRVKHHHHMHPNVNSTNTNPGLAEQDLELISPAPSKSKTSLVTTVSGGETWADPVKPLNISKKNKPASYHHYRHHHPVVTSTPKGPSSATATATISTSSSSTSKRRKKRSSPSNKVLDKYSTTPLPPLPTQKITSDNSTKNSKSSSKLDAESDLESKYSNSPSNSPTLSNESTGFSYLTPQSSPPSLTTSPSPSPSSSSSLDTKAAALKNNSSIKYSSQGVKESTTTSSKESSIVPPRRSSLEQSKHISSIIKSRNSTILEDGTTRNRNSFEEPHAVTVSQLAPIQYSVSQDNLNASSAASAAATANNSMAVTKKPFRSEDIVREQKQQHQYRLSTASLVSNTNSIKSAKHSHTWSESIRITPQDKFDQELAQLTQARERFSSSKSNSTLSITDNSQNINNGGDQITDSSKRHSLGANVNFPPSPPSVAAPGTGGNPVKLLTVKDWAVTNMMLMNGMLPSTAAASAPSATGAPVTCATSSNSSNSSFTQESMTANGGYAHQRLSQHSIRRLSSIHSQSAGDEIEELMSADNDDSDFEQNFNEDILTTNLNENINSRFSMEPPPRLPNHTAHNLLHSSYYGDEDYDNNEEEWEDQGYNHEWNNMYTQQQQHYYSYPTNSYQYQEEEQQHQQQHQLQQQLDDDLQQFQSESDSSLVSSSSSSSSFSKPSSSDNKFVVYPSLPKWHALSPPSSPQPPKFGLPEIPESPEP